MYLCKSYVGVVLKMPKTFNMRTTLIQDSFLEATFLSTCIVQYDTNSIEDDEKKFSLNVITHKPCTNNVVPKMQRKVAFFLLYSTALLDEPCKSVNVKTVMILKTMKCMDGIVLALLALGTNLPLPLLLLPLVSVQGEDPGLLIVLLCQLLVPQSYDSRYVTTLYNAMMNLTVVSHPDTPWMQLDLNLTCLALNVKLILGDWTFAQVLDATALARASDGYSAVLNRGYASMELAQLVGEV
jgi:hypothetical protein